MGQVLALGKDQEIKKSISDLKTNFQSLTQQMRSDYEQEMTKLSPDEKLSHDAEIDKMAKQAETVHQ